MTAIVACPKCSQKMRVPTDRGELTIRCPSCRHSWDWPIKETASSAGSEEGNREEDTSRPDEESLAVASRRTQLAREYAQKGDAQRELGNYDQAIADCTQAIRVDSTIGYPWGIRGLCYQLKGNLDQAISDCTEAIRLEPQHGFNYDTRAECYRLIGKIDLAMADCNVVIRLDPTSAHAYRTRAGLHLKALNLDATIADCDEAIRLDPSWAAYKAYTRRGIASFYKGEIEKAVADCSEAIRLYPHDGLAFLGRADAFLAKGDTGRAIQDCTEAIQLNPKDGMAYKTRAVAHLTKGEFDKAIADCNETLRINPKIASAFAARGEAHRMKGDLDPAFSDFTESIRLDPSDLNAFCMRGHIHAQRGDLPNALADLVVANQLKPSGESNAIALAQLFHPPAPFSTPQVLMQYAEQQSGVNVPADGKSPDEDSPKVATQEGQLLFYLLNTGHASIEARKRAPHHAADEVDGMLNNVKRMLVAGRHLVTMIRGGYECEVAIHHTGLLATVMHRQRVLVTFGIAPDNENPAQVWQALESAYWSAQNPFDHKLKKPVRRPEYTPWCAVLVGNVRQDEGWVNGLGGLMAWAWIDKIREKHGDGASHEKDSLKPSSLGNDLLHHTMNTGHSVFVPRTFAPDGAVKAAKDMLVSGKHPITYFGNNGYECDVTIVKQGLLATVYKGERPLVNFGVAPDVLSSIDLSFVMIGNHALFQRGQTVEQALAGFPKVVPWCVVICLSDRQDEMWVANFEQMVAWAWIEKVRAQDAK